MLVRLLQLSRARAKGLEELLTRERQAAADEVDEQAVPAQNEKWEGGEVCRSLESRQGRGAAYMLTDARW